jgi:predicted trehalose synthase
MAVKLPTIAELVDARWFAGKGRAVAGVEEVGRLAPEGAGGAAVVFVDVAYEDGGVERYALALRDGRQCAEDDRLWTALALDAGADVTRGRSRFLAEDLSNTVVSLDDRLVLKLFRRLERGPHPEAELLEALDGFAHVPALTGVVERDGMTIALVEEYADGTSVGWEDLIGRLAAGEDATGDAGDLGRVAAALHRRLAEVLGTRTGDAADLAAELAGVRSHGSDPRTAGDELSTALDAHLAKLDRLLGARLQRVHGDFHVGQVLRTAKGLVVIDFEGDPSLPLRERSRERSLLVDLASLLLSLDHAGCAAARREPSFDWRVWSREARTACLAGYEDEIGAIDRELLRGLEVAKELRELVYAERWLPEWLYAPRAVLPTLLDDT